MLAACLVLGLPAASIPAASADRRERDTWSDYHAILWQPPKAGNCGALEELGIDSVAVIAENRDKPAQGHDRQVAPLLRCNLRWYVENIATDFYSAYHRWSGELPVNWRFIESRKAYRENPLDLRAFVREPSLSDPVWQERIRERLIETVRVHRSRRPLYYALGDEPGIADLSVFWDFDFSQRSLDGMRRWLKERYTTLAALNRQWDSRFADWPAVIPPTTAEAMTRADGNFSAWADFKEWMDVEFARALERGTRAIHSGDAGAYAAIEGAQIPGWGGYDYSRLASAVDLMELYDGGGNIEIVRSLNPDLVLLTTSFGGGAAEAHGLWRALLRGGRGVIFWDPRHEIVREDGTVGERGRALAAPLREIKSGLGALLIHSRRQVAPVAILYSPASMRTQWMLDWQPRGNAWSERDAKALYEDASAVRSSMKGFLDFLGHVGLEGRVLVPELVENGALRRGIRVLILPRVLALSEREAEEIRRFVAAGGTLVADGEPGRFDRHSRRLAQPLLAGLFREATDPSRSRFRFGTGKTILAASPAGSDASDRPPPLRREPVGELMRILDEAGVEPPFTLTREDGKRALDVETQLWSNGETTIIALQREAGWAGAEPIRLDLREAARLYDLRARTYLATSKHLEVTIDPVTPTLLAVSKDAGPTVAISGPRRAVAGDPVTIGFDLSRNEGGTRVLRVEVFDPHGRFVASRSRNILMHDAHRAQDQLDFAETDIPGTWRIRATDIQTGNAAAKDLELAAAGDR